MIKEKKIILTIEDEKPIRESFKAFLEDINYTVIEAEDGEQGIELFRTHSPDLILLDLRMPKMSGFDVLTVVVKESRQTPVIVVSGNDIISEIIKAIRLGAWDYILKPIVDLNILEHSIKIAIEKAELINKNLQYQNNLEQMVKDRTKKLEQEIASRKATEVILEKSEKSLTSILNSIPDIIYRLNESGTITYINNSVKEYGYIPEDLIGKNIYSFVHPDDKDNAKYNIDNRRKGVRKTINFEIRLFPKSKILSPEFDEPIDPVFIVDAEGMYTNDNGDSHFIGTQGVARDITERKINQNKIQKSLEEKEALLREVHHRVKNNLQIISSLLNMQMKDSKIPEIQEILQESKNRILSMAIVHESIYKTDDFSKINITFYIRNICSQVFFSYNIDSEIDVIYDMDEIFVSLDSSIPLGIILNELFSNALKYAFKKNKSGLIFITLKKKSDDYAILHFKDNGQGFTENFDFENTNSMGLNLVKTLTRQIDGTLSFETSSEGSSFLIEFFTQLNQSSL